MKNNLVKTTVLSLFVAFAFSCKNDRQNQVETTDAQDVLERSQTSISYNVNTETSKIDWEGSKPNGTHTGFLKISSGVINLTPENNVESGDIALNISSITVTDLDGEMKAKLEAHLKGTTEEGRTDFFDTSNHPNGAFEITGVRVADGKTYLQGNLTLKEISKNIEFPVNVSLNGDNLLLQSEKFTINRTEWGINYGSKSIFDNLGDNFINDHVSLTIYVEATKA